MNVDCFAYETARRGGDWLKGVSSRQFEKIESRFPFWARLDQLPPPGAWTTWLILGGRGAGKTRSGAEWILEQVRRGAQRLAIIGETYEDVREVMIEGPSGLAHIGREEERPTYQPSRHRLTWKSGATAHAFSADDPDGLRGYQFEYVWADELAKWRRPEDAWSNVQLSLRLGDNPRQVVTTTPRPIPILKELMASEQTATTRAATSANRAALAETFLTEVTRSFAGTRLGRQELEGQILDDLAGALWSWPLIEAARKTYPEQFSRIVIAVDPPVTSGPDADACGIVLAAMATIDGVQCGIVLGDFSMTQATPTEWAARVADLYHEHQVDRVVVEVNQGGDLVTEMIRIADPTVPVRAVRATRSKIVRAEPVAALYEQGRVIHASAFPELESEMTRYTGVGGEKSPDRLDALVWALTDLMLGPAVANPAIKTL